MYNTSNHISSLLPQMQAAGIWQWHERISKHKRADGGGLGVCEVKGLQETLVATVAVSMLNW